MIETAKIAAVKGGEILRESFGLLRKNQINLKGRGDYVTELDRRSEDSIIGIIKEKYPHHAIQAEESRTRKIDSGFQWIIDPLDGTANYVHGIPVYAVSIAVAKDNDILCGVVYNPQTEVMYWAEKGKGAYKDDSRISVSNKNDMSTAMLATGFPWRTKENFDSYLNIFRDLFLSAAGIRRMGAAAVDLAYTACGIFDGFWEMKLKPWDIAAGILLIKEAGGIVSDFQGEETYLETGNITAGNEFIHKEIIKVTRRH